MKASRKKIEVIECGGYMPREKIEKLANHWCANIFNILGPTGIPKLTIEQCFAVYFWKSVIENDMNAILKSLEKGGNNGQKTE